MEFDKEVFIEALKELRSLWDVNSPRQCLEKMV